MLRGLLAAVGLALVLAPAGLAGDPFAVTPAGLVDGQTVSGVVHVAAALTGAPAQRVEFSIDGRMRSVAVADPFAFDWDTTREQNGPHVLELWAVAPDGTVATAQITLVVANAFQLSLGGVAEGQQLTGTVHLAPQVDGLPAQWIQVLVDGELRWTLDRAPYGVDWNTALETPGPHTISLWAVAIGGMVTQVDVHVIVAGGQTTDQRTLLAQATRYRAETWRLQMLMRAPRTSPAPLQGTLTELVVWRSRAATARQRAAHPPHLDEWLCIHSHEGSWTADTGNGYFGGLQMNAVFQRSYAPELIAAKGTADNWTPLEQMWVAERAWASGRGFRPWPQTARMCDLL